MSLMWGEPEEANLFDVLWCRAVYDVGQTEFPHLVSRVASIRGAFAEGRVVDVEQFRRVLSGVGVDADLATPLLESLEAELRKLILEAARNDSRAFMPAIVDELVDLGWVVEHDILDAIQAVAQDVADIKRGMRPPSEPPPPPCQVPQALAHFVGRFQQIANLREALVAEGAVVCVFALSGMGGVGKSALAARVAHGLHAEGRFPDGVLWADLSAQPPHGVAADFVRAYGYTDDQIPESFEARCALYRTVLHSKRALVVMDNAPHEEAVVPLLPGARDVAVVVTTRQALAGARELLTHWETLDVFPPDEASALLREYVGTRADAEPKAVAAICRLVGYLPLAVDIAGCRLADPGRWPRLAPFVDRLSVERTRLDELKIGDRAERDVRAVLGVSYEVLDAGQRELFAHLSLMGRMTFGSSAVAAVLRIPKQEALDGLADLVDLSLCVRSVDGGFRLHDLVRLFASERLDAEFLADTVGAARQRFAEYEETRHRAAAEGASASRLAREGRWQEAQVAWEASRHTNEMLGHRKGLAQALGGLASAYAQQGQWAEAVKAYEEAQTLNLELGDRVGQAKASGGLASAYAKQGERAKAIRAYEDALAIQKALNDRPRLAQTFGGLASVYAQQEQWAKAVEAYENALALTSELGDRVGRARALGGLASVYAQQEEWAKAVEAYEKDLALTSELGDRVGQAQALGGLASVYSQQEEWAKAVQAYEDALAIQEALNDRPRVAQTLGGLASAYAGQADWAKAVESYEKALAIQEALNDRPRMAQTLGGLGTALLRARRPHEAAERLEQAAAIQRSLDDRRHLPVTLYNLAKAYDADGETEAAARCAIEGLRTAKGRTRTNLESLLRRLGASGHDGPRSTDGV